jgi:hypothetical protein
MTKFKIVFSGGFGAPRLIVNPVDVNAKTLEETLKRAKTIARHLVPNYWHCAIFDEKTSLIVAEFTFEQQAVIKD